MVVETVGILLMTFNIGLLASCLRWDTAQYRVRVRHSNQHGLFYYFLMFGLAANTNQASTIR